MLVRAKKLQEDDILLTATVGRTAVSKVTRLREGEVEVKLSLGPHLLLHPRAKVMIYRPVTEF